MNESATLPNQNIMARRATRLKKQKWRDARNRAVKSMEAGASGVVGQNAARLVGMGCGHVNESATHPNLHMMARRAMRLKK